GCASGNQTDMSANLVASETVSLQPEDVAIAIGRIVDSVDRSPKAGERWVVKLNLTYPSYLPGVVNSPIFVEGLCRWAAWHSVRLVFIEGDGGNGAYSAQNAFDGNGITELVNRYGMKCASISEKPWSYRETAVENKVIRLPYSQFCIERQYDRFVSAPL